MNLFERIIKFSFDRLMALIGLVVLALPLAVIAIAVRLSLKKGTALYSQTRVGKDGKLFKIHKFRTMVDESGDGKGWSIAYPNRDRVTPMGAWLRRHKLDELPELWDVLIGNMSLVGPRPDVPGYADQLQGDDRVVLKMRPGITGPATLKYRNEEQLIGDYVKQALAEGDTRSELEIAQWYNDEVIYPDKVRINVDYYHHFSFYNDIKILFQTFF